MNEALVENLFVVVVCLLTKCPVFVVGKPGSSKTLTMQVLATNLLGEQSPNKFWRKFPGIHIFPYQCSPMSTSDGISQQFHIACSYQEQATGTIAVLLLDEVGLAEHSPDMPLKVLHGILVEPPIAVVGLSNWTLDPAKMNRAVCLQRPEPSEADIALTGQRIIGATFDAPETTIKNDEGATEGSGDGSMPPLAPPLLRRQSSIARRLGASLAPLAKAYHSVYAKQEGRDYIGTSIANYHCPHNVFPPIHPGLAFFSHFANPQHI